jgi:hypothetical protein
MKYKVGDKVRYDGGDWWFYATVTAVFEHSICPCYRLSVERMEKKSCKFSITQFEFELEPDEKVDSSMVEPKWENLEIENLKKQIKKKKPSKRKIGNAWMRNLESYNNGERNNAVYTWITHNRRQYKSGNLSEEKLEKLMEINFPFGADKKNRPIIGENDEKAPKRKRGEAGDNKDINSPFDAGKKKDDSWDNQLEEWEKGNRKSIPVQQWRRESIRQFLEGKLSVDRIAKLKEIGILK